MKGFPYPLWFTLPVSIALVGFGADAIVRTGERGIVTAILGLLAWLFFHRTVTLRALRIVQVSRRLASGEHTVRSKLRGSDELAEISRSFDRMVDALVSAEAEKKRAAELAKAYQELKETQSMLVQSEKMAAMGQLASGIAHEVKNPLAILLQGVNYLEGEFTGKRLPEQAGRFIGEMKDAVGRADRIIRGLLDFSRPAPLVSQPVPMEKVINTALGLLREQVRLGGVEVIREIPPGLPPVAADENQLTQVFLNLFLNAFHAMPQGGTLRIRLSSRPLASDEGRSEREFIFCEVADTGVGIPPEHLSKLFEPFFTTKPPGQGTGLGLAIVRRIVEDHHGMIDIQSRQGEGTRVMVAVPAAA